MTNRIFVPVLALLLGASACAPNRQPGDDPQAQAQSTRLRVTNQAWLDMTVYVLDSGGSARTRLGQVSGNSSVTLRIPDGVVGLGRPLRFMVDPIGSQAQATSFEMFVRPGQDVTITIPPSVGR